MLYLLLTIIAVGVLLASKEGKKLLSWIVGTIVGVAVLFIAFWMIVDGIALLQIPAFGENDTGTMILSSLILLYFAFYIVGFCIQLLKITRDKGRIEGLKTFLREQAVPLSVIAFISLIVIFGYLPI